ncbi:MAG: BatA domain-containing protein, partial [Planctomycetes bacterium]|nr:BatA domain-containing protein [Planctomycetota bacterium]
MGFLTPLYIAGLTAIALPLVFHLIRRTPRGQTPFSSLMFLTPSPPRITRRSRLDNLLLLLLRALALALLAIAFARPFFREAAQFSLDSSQGQRVAILVDASASMRRGDLWRQAQEEVAAILEELKPTDRVALFAFDRDVRTLMDFDDQTEIDPWRRASLAARRLRETSPSWAATDVGGALAIVADRLDALDQGQATESELRRRLVLVSDLQQGARLDALQAYQWPDGVELEVETLTPVDPTNAGVHLAGGVVEEAPDSPASGGRLHRVRVVNNEDAVAEQFQLLWLDAEGGPVGDATSLYVPPGQSRVTTVERPEDSRDLRLTLRGDAHPFDNTVYFAPPLQEEITVVYLGADPTDDPQGVLYYLQRAFPDGPQREVEVVTPQSHEPLQSPGAAPPKLVVIAQPLDEMRSAEVRRYVERGGRALIVATDVETAASAAPLFAPQTLTVEEAAPADYALLGEIDFTHPLLAPFADPRYSDFTKIHFWKHRRVKFAENRGDEEAADVRVLVRFDNRDLALMESRLGDGRAYLLATSWRPEDSQLAR